MSFRCGVHTFPHQKLRNHVVIGSDLPRCGVVIQRSFPSARRNGVRVDMSVTAHFFELWSAFQRLMSRQEIESGFVATIRTSSHKPHREPLDLDACSPHSDPRCRLAVAEASRDDDDHFTSDSILVRRGTQSWQLRLRDVLSLHEIATLQEQSNHCHSPQSNVVFLVIEVVSGFEVHESRMREKLEDEELFVRATLNSALAEYRSILISLSVHPQDVATWRRILDMHTISMCATAEVKKELIVIGAAIVLFSGRPVEDVMRTMATTVVGSDHDELLGLQEWRNYVERCIAHSSTLSVNCDGGGGGGAIMMRVARYDVPLGAQLERQPCWKMMCQVLMDMGVVASKRLAVPYLCTETSVAAAKWIDLGSTVQQGGWGPSLHGDPPMKVSPLCVSVLPHITHWRVRCRVFVDASESEDAFVAVEPQRSAFPRRPMQQQQLQCQAPHVSPESVFALRSACTCYERWCVGVVGEPRRASTTVDAPLLLEQFASHLGFVIPSSARSRLDRPPPSQTTRNQTVGSSSISRFSSDCYEAMFSTISAMFAAHHNEDTARLCHFLCGLNALGLLNDTRYPTSTVSERIQILCNAISKRFAALLIVGHQ